MAPRNSNNKIAHGLVAMSSAAVMAVYAAGYVRTQSAANLLEGQTSERRRPVAVRTPVVEPTATPVPVAAPEAAPASVKPETPVSEKAAVPVARAEVVKPKPVEVASSSVPSSVEMAPPSAEPPAPVIAPVPEPAPAPAPPPPPPTAPAAPPKPVWKDGTYNGWGTSRHGDIQAAVVIQGGRIASATIAQCLTRYSCDVIDKIIPQVAVRQSPDIDYVSGATQSSDAFYYAVVDALSKAK
jgi:uncharacterized protein with FMN-binding domain